MKLESNWVKAYQIIVILVTIGIVLAGIILGWDVSYTRYGRDMLLLLIYVAISLVAAGINLIMGMLLCEFFNNVCHIANKIDEK